jgi:hypothetical protein
MRQLTRQHLLKAVAGALTLLTAFVLVAPREWSGGRDRDARAIRTTRVGAYRLDPCDAAPHDYEDAEIVVAPQSDLIDSAARGLVTPDSTEAVQAQSGSHLDVVGVAPVQPPRAHLRARPHRPSLGRSPPLA